MFRLSFLLPFRFRQKRIQLSEYLTYPHTRLHSDRLAGLFTPFLLPPEAAKDCPMEFFLS